MNYKLKIALTALTALVSFAANADFKQAPLPYSSQALEPAIDQMTMEIHYGKHHKAYVDNLNAQIKNYPVLDQLSIEAILPQISQYNAAVRNNAGGHFNHTFFWNSLAPVASTGKPSAQLLKKIDQDFGSFENFKAQFNAAATARFGSGWAWLIVLPNGKLAITSTANQDNPLMDVADVKGQPLLGLDVWEHAYYLKYQNRRADYTQAFWSIVNWNSINQRYAEAIQQR
ncbi:MULTISPECIES: superoxide dismutase [unclassified Acinetobacter]|uniref:superoxide dismutase n=1 Tax=unclassified Acinetobacter TaxID=196816 RepID=UPI0029343E58|nr:MULTISPECIES: superoxide dismutase [unclassified Acinetobacter]WOE32024.1 superoxide dismutase [Acinetobacter sp. SAAs470]WOE37492.1 superoxide dismutase [Acinetobacter sp. SAAs474]